MKEEDKAEYYKWYSSKDKNIKPLNGELVLVTVWYDYWVFDVGYYLEDSDEVRFFLKSQERRLSLSDIDNWMMIKEPQLETNNL